MVDISDLVPSFFKAGDQNDPRVNQALRQRIALQLMANKKAYPKNVGEGLSAIGDAIGDRGLAQQLAQSDVAAQDAAAKLGAGTPTETPTETPTGTPTGTPGYAPTDTSVPPAVGAINNAISGGASPVAETPVAAAPTALAPATSVAGIQPAVSPVPRNNIAGALMAQRQPPAQAVPQPNPTLPGADGAPGGQPDQRLAFNGTPSAPSGIQPAPPVPSGIRAVPPPQVAQAQQQYPPGYVPPQPGAPQGVPIIPMSQRERELRLLLAKNQGNPYAAQSPAAIELGNLVEQRTARQNEANEWYKAQVQQATEQAKIRLGAQTGQAEAIQKWRKGEQEIIQQPEQAGGSAMPPVRVAGSGVPTVDPRLGTPQSPQRTGVPVAPPGTIPQQFAEKQAPQIIASVNKAVPALEQSLKLIELARNHPGLDLGTGGLGRIARAMPGTSAYDFGALIDQIKAKNFLAGYETLKGAGAIGEKEGAKGEAAQGNLDPNQSKDAVHQALDRLEQTLRRSVEEAQRQANRPVTAWQKNNEDQVAPDKGQIVSGFTDGKTREYLGGDPRNLKESWRIVQ